MKIFKDTMKMHNQIFKDEHRHYMQIQVKRKQKKVLERIFPFLYFHFAEAFLSTLHLSSWFILKTFAIQEIILFRHNLLHLLRVSFLCHHKATKARNFFLLPWLVCHWYIVCLSDFCRFLFTSWAFTLQLFKSSTSRNPFVSFITSDDRSFYWKMQVANCVSKKWRRMGCWSSGSCNFWNGILQVDFFVPLNTSFSIQSSERHLRFIVDKQTK